MHADQTMHDRSRKKNMHCWEGGNFSLRNSAEKAGVLGATLRAICRNVMFFSPNLESIRADEESAFLKIFFPK